jgi:nucleotidyltransferase substrate binding protein (TIGR01987 family)
MGKTDVRWKQRFQNYQKALQGLEDAMQIAQPDIFQRAGLIQFFEMSFELSWNVLKDYLESQGFADVTSPRAAIKKAYETALVDNGETWLTMLEDRNLTAHTYDESSAVKIERLIREKYFPLLVALRDTLLKAQP